MKCVSLFSGCGGLDLGLEQAGFEVVLANDMDKYCAVSHERNFPKTKFHCGSVTDLTPAFLRKALGASFGKIDLLAGGPPCPPFSKSRFYRKEKPRALEDPVGNETINGYLNVLRTLRPKAFLLENVFGMAYKVHQDALQFILKTVSDLGYSTERRVLNAADYGVPQIRERFFLVGTLKPGFAFPPQSHRKSDAEITLFNADLPPWVGAGEAIGDLDTEANASDEGHFAGGKHHDLLCKVPPGDNYLFFTKERGHPKPQFVWRSRYWSFLLKLSPKMPSWTIQARRSNNMGPLHWRNRILRVGEVKRLQTFPDDWHLSGTVERQWRQVGNAVPPLLGKVLGDAIARHIGQARQTRVREAAATPTTRSRPRAIARKGVA